MCAHMHPCWGIPKPRVDGSRASATKKGLHMYLFKKKNDQPVMKKVVSKKVNRKRTERLCLGLTPEEKKLITDSAESVEMSRTDFILNAVEGNRIMVMAGLYEVLLELNRQGNNLNQVARKLNQNGLVNGTEVEKTCRLCQNAYEQLVRFVDRWNIVLVKMKEES